MNDDYWTGTEIENKAWLQKISFQQYAGLKKVRPIGSVYECAECGDTFVENQEIHIPLCRSCRAELHTELKQSKRPDWAT